MKNSFKFNFLKSKIIKKHGKLISGPSAYLVSGALINQRKIIKIMLMKIDKSYLFIIFFVLYFLKKLIIKSRRLDVTMIIAPICNNAALKK